MTPDSDTATPATTTTAKRAYTARGDIDKGLLADIQTGRNVLGAANDPNNNTAIVTRVKPAVLTRLDGNIKTVADSPDTNLSKDVINMKKAAVVATEDEATARGKLMAKLRVIQKAAAVTYKKDKARRAAYLIGKHDFGNNRAMLEADASAIINLAKSDTLDTLLLADTTDAQKALDEWKEADKTQRAAEGNYSHAVEALQAIVELINEDRRTIQAAADMLYPFKPVTNAATRRTFDMPAGRPMKF